MTSHTILTLSAMLLASGAFAGMVAGLLGVGGGVVLVPVLSLLLGFLGISDDIAMHIAVATSLTVIIATAISSARAHRAKRALDLSTVRRWMPAMALGALTGALLARTISGDVLRVLFVALAFIVGISFIRGPGKTAPKRNMTLPTIGHYAVALLIGTLSAWLGIGGGSMSVPTLQATGLSVHKAVGTSALLGLAIAIPGAIGFMIAGQGVTGRPVGSVGYVYWPAALTLAATAALLAPVGAKLAHRLDQQRLRQIFGIFLLLAGSNMLVKTWS
ncbi:MAG: sulfite exporter TauE/SafE family protein [Pseudomonadota bacterium]